MSAPKVGTDLAPDEHPKLVELHRDLGSHLMAWPTWKMEQFSEILVQPLAGKGDLKPQAPVNSP